MVAIDAASKGRPTDKICATLRSKGAEEPRHTAVDAAAAKLLRFLLQEAN
jgi:hypothetical protein